MSARASTSRSGKWSIAITRRRTTKLRASQAGSHQADAVLPRRSPKPALGRAEEGALVAEAQQIARVRERQLGIAEVLLGQLAARVIQETLEGGSLRLQASLQRSLAHLQCIGDVRTPRLASRQAANDRGASSAAGLGMVQPLEMLAGKPLMQLGEQRMRRRQRRDDVGAGEQQGIRRRIEAQRAFESILVWPRIGRWWKPQFERKRT